MYVVPKLQRFISQRWVCILKCLCMNNISFYNIAFVNSERWLAKSRVDITQCQHGNVGKFISLYFFVLYYKTNINIFSVYWYAVISTLVEIGKTRSTQFLVFPFSTRVDITVYQHGKCFIFVKYLRKYFMSIGHNEYKIFYT
jgi:hypothetical protein